MLAKQTASVAAACSRAFSGNSSSCVTASRCLLKARSVSSPLAAFSSSQSAQSEQKTELVFAIKDKSGARLTGEAYIASVKEQVAKESEEDYAAPKSALLTLATEYDVLREESAEWKGKYQRALAETENVRRRGMKQTDDAKQFAVQGFCKDLLEVADILDLAVNSVKPEQLETADKSLKDLHSGIAMTKTVLLKVFEKHGVVPVNPVGQPFDPNTHEAVFQVPAEQAGGVAPGSIAHVMKIGYSLRERPIRAAQVGVVTEKQ